MSTKRNTILAFVAIVLSSALSVPVRPQQKKAPDDDVVRIAAELVQVDAIVKDKDGKRVADLKREDFDLYDNKKLQQITNFSYEKARLRTPDGGGEEVAVLRAITPAQLNRVVAFVIDTLHMKTENVYRTRAMLDDFVQHKMAPGDLVLILPTSGGSGLYQQFTSDQRVLGTAISQLRPAFIFDNDTPSRRGGTSQQILELLPALPESRGGGITQAPGQGGTGTTPAVSSMVEDADVSATLGTLNSLVSAMRKLPGRKISVLVSEGFRTLKSQMSADLTETIARAARANVVFYSIDPGGLEPLGYTAGDAYLDISRGPLPTDPLAPAGVVLPSADPAANTTVSDRRKDYFESQDSLNAIAVDTGGKFFRNSNDIKQGLTEILEENSAYYLLGFQPDRDKWDGKFHSIKLEVRNRPDLVVTTRKGYVARSDKPIRRGNLTPKALEILEAIGSPLVRRDMDLQLTSFYRDDVRHEPIITSLLHIDLSKLKLKQVDGKYRGKIEVVGFMLDAAGRAADSLSTTADLNLDQQAYQNLMEDGLLVTHEIKVRPGAYQLKILAREADSGIIGTAASYVEIPDFKSDRLALSSIFIDAQLLQTTKSKAETSLGTKLSQRRFPRNGSLTYVLIVYNAKKGAAQLQMTTRIVKGNRVIFSGQPRPVEVLEGSSPPSRIVTGGIFQLGSLAPGDYRLEVAIADKARQKESVARQEIDFTVQ